MTEEQTLAEAAGAARLRRDRVTLTIYTLFVTWGWFLYAFSPAVPLIAEELGVSRALAGLHGTALAVGTVLTGMLSSAVAVRLGRRLQSVLGAGFIVAGVTTLLLGGTLAATLTACLITSIGGNLALSAAQPALAVHHGPAGPAAVTEANAMGATVGLFAPLALGASVGLGWGWRPAVALVAVLAAASALLLLPLRSATALGRGNPGRARRRKASTPASATTARPTDSDGLPDAATSRFPSAFWFFWLAMITGVAVEFATTFWAADLIVQQTRAPASVATAAVAALILGMAVSRFVVGPLSLRKAPEKLLLVGFAAAGVGWLVFWLAPTPAVAVVGLVVAGLGFGTHYPLTISLTLRASQGRPDQAQARSTLGAGAAIGAAPFLLGALADVVGAHRAFLLVPVLLVLGAAATLLGLRSVQGPLRHSLR